MLHRNPQRQLELNAHQANLMPTKTNRAIRLVFSGLELSAYFPKSDNFCFSYAFRISRIIESDYIHQQELSDELKVRRVVFHLHVYTIHSPYIQIL